MTLEDILSSVPDDVDSNIVGAWAEQEALHLSKNSFTEKQKTGLVAVDGANVEKDERQFARFINAALLADWACYSKVVDRADYERLSAVIKTFAQGFRVWFCKFGDAYKPVGYTGWYPIKGDIFTKAHDHAEAISNRAELWPQSKLSTPQGDYVWLFNYSIVKPLRKSSHSKQLLEKYAEDLSRQNILGMAAAVLSPESERVASRFGLNYRGDMSYDGVKEKLFAVRLHPKQTVERT